MSATKKGWICSRAQDIFHRGTHFEYILGDAKETWIFVVWTFFLVEHFPNYMAVIMSELYTFIVTLNPTFDPKENLRYVFFTLSPAV